jgi:TRAP-type mannitol/chloroaromatic compound transport system permease large subunit
MAAIGIILLIVGAVVVWGVDTAVDGVDLQAIGYIVMAAIQALGWWSRSTTTMQTERHVSPDGRHYVEETRTD